MDVVTILSTLLLCVEISKTLRVRVPVSCVAPLKDFMKDCGEEEKGSFVDEEKFKETLSGGEEDAAKGVIQFVLDVVKEIQGSVDQLGRPNATQKKKGTKRAPKLEVIKEEEEEMELGEEEESSEEVGGSEELSIREESGHENDNKEESGHENDNEESGHENDNKENNKEESDNNASDHDKTNTHEEPQQQNDNPTSLPHASQQKNDDSPPNPTEPPTETTLPHPVDSDSDSFYDEPEYCHCLFPKPSLYLLHTFNGNGKSLWERGRRLGGNDNPYQK